MKRRSILISLLFVGMLVCCLYLPAQAATSPLPAKKAFDVSAMVMAQPVDYSKLPSLQADNVKMVRISWHLAKDYFLYQDRIHIALAKGQKGARLGLFHLPQGQVYHHPILGEHAVYADQLSIIVPIIHPVGNRVRLRVNYQGCAAFGYCYPPMQALLSLDLRRPNTRVEAKMVPAVFAVSQRTQAQNNITSTFNKQSIWYVLLSFIGFGLLLSLTPCVLPMVPILSGVILGQASQITVRKGLLLSLAYVLGMAFTYAVLGIVIALLGNNFQASLQTPWLIGLFSALFVVLALSMFGLYELRLPSRFVHILHLMSERWRSGTYLGVFVMGALAALLVSPCVSAPLVGALAYISQTGDVVLGGLALFCLGFGMGLPLLLIGASGGKLLPKSGHWMQHVKVFLGFLLLGVAVYFLDRILPALVTMLLWSALILALGVWIWLIKPARLSFYLIAKLCSVVTLVWAAMMLVGALIGNTSPWQPLKNVRYSLERGWQYHHDRLDFVRIKSIADLNMQLAKAKQENKPVMLDFYASWCIACKVMARNVFDQSDVIDALSPFVVLQADITRNDALDHALLNYLGVVAPPTVIFFDKHGQAMPQKRIVGEVGKADFLAHLEHLSGDMRADGLLQARQ